MKTVVVEIQTPGAGDLVILNAEHPKGGKISVKRKLLGARKRPTLDEGGFVVGVEELPADDQRAIASDFAQQITKDWMKECVQAKVKPDTGALIINCTDLFSDVLFTTEVHGDAGTIATLNEF